MPDDTFDQHGASDFTELALSRIPSTFGKLAFLAALKQSNTGRYDHPLTALVYGKDQIDAALRQKHREMFYAWLGVALARQTEDVAEYLASQADGQNPLIAQTLQRWVQERSYEKLIPEAVSGPERELFSSDLRAILQLLQVRLGSTQEA
jgi:hypothetical protein